MMKRWIMIIFLFLIQTACATWFEYSGTYSLNEQMREWSHVKSLELTEDIWKVLEPMGYERQAHDDTEGFYYFWLPTKSRKWQSTGTEILVNVSKERPVIGIKKLTNAEESEDVRELKKAIEDEVQRKFGISPVFVVVKERGLRL